VVEWPPAARPYDFLAMIEAEEALRSKQEDLARTVVRLSKSGMLSDTSMDSRKLTESTNNTANNVAQGITASGQYAADIQQQTGSTSGVVLENKQ
jgi:hypothetical protein